MQHLLWNLHHDCSISIMEKEALDPVAAHLISSYVETALYSRRFRDDYHKMPPTLMAKVHHMRSIMQARLTNDVNFELSKPYAEFGRVQFTDLASGSELLLRSAGALQVERLVEDGQGELFSAAGLIKTSDVQLVVYKFTKDSVILSIAPTIQRPGHQRLLAMGEPTLMGVWPYLLDEEIVAFDQDLADPFGDVGEIGLEDGEEGAV